MMNKVMVKKKHALFESVYFFVLKYRHFPNGIKIDKRKDYLIPFF